MVAFEVTEQGGESIDTNGYLRLANGDTISVSTLREGRGLFVYTPTAEPATLTMRNRKGREYDFELPQAEETGCVLSANILGKDNIRLRVSRGMQFRERLAMMLVNNGNVEVFEEIPQNMPTAEYTIPKKLLNDGVSQVAVINPNGDILAERMVFVYPQTRYDTIKVEAQNKQLIPCGRITLDAETRANTTFSVAVRDYDTEKNGSSMNAATWLLLSSELKGYIHNAEYYLENDDEKHRRAADLLMMVQGWSRYDLPMMMGRKAFESKQPIEEGLLVDGRLRQKTKKDSVDNVDMRITLFNRLGNSMSGKARTDKEGNYVFGIPDCEGEFSLILHTKKDGKDTDYRIGINRTFSPVGRRLSPYEIQRHPLDTPMIKIMVPDNFDYMIPTKTDKYNKVLRDVVVKGRRIYDNARAAWENESFGEYKAVVRYDCQKEVDKLLDEGKDLPRFFDWLKGRNKFFEGSSADMEMAITDDDWTHQAEKPFSNSDDIHHVFGEMGRVRSRIGHQILLPFQELSYKNRPVVWILNNQYYYTSMVSVAVGHLDFHSYDNISPEQMPFDLGEFKSVYITENEVEWMQYTNIDNLVRYSPVTVFLYTFHEFPVGNIGGRRTTFDAYARKETYDMPDYSVIPPMADYRRTLYWNPNVKTDKNGKAKIEFYNNSTCRQIIVSAEGITTDGRAVVY